MIANGIKQNALAMSFSAQPKNKKSKKQNPKTKRKSKVDKSILIFIFKPHFLMCQVNLLNKSMPL